MKFVMKAVITGFAWSLGAALFKKIQHRIGLGQPDDKSDAVKEGAASDPGLQTSNLH